MNSRPVVDFLEKAMGLRGAMKDYLVALESRDGLASLPGGTSEQIHDLDQIILAYRDDLKQMSNQAEEHYFAACVHIQDAVHGYFESRIKSNSPSRKEKGEVSRDNAHQELAAVMVKFEMVFSVVSNAYRLLDDMPQSIDSGDLSDYLGVAHKHLEHAIGRLNRLFEDHPYSMFTGIVTKNDRATLRGYINLFEDNPFAVRPQSEKIGPQQDIGKR